MSRLARPNRERRREILSYNICSTRSLKHPQRLGREFDEVIAWLERRRGISAHGEMLAREHQLPALAEIHRRLELHLQPVGARARHAAHALEPDDADGLSPDGGC